MAYDKGHLGEFVASTNTFTSTSRPLTPEERSIVWDDITSDPTGRGYQGQDDQGIANLFNAEQRIPNPEPQHQLLRRHVSKDEFVAFFFDEIALLLQADAGGTGVELRAQAEAIVRLLGLSNAYIDLTSPQISSFLNGMVTAGVMTQDDLDARVHYPDPAYQPEIVLPSRGEAILNGVTLEPGDLAACHTA